LRHATDYLLIFAFAPQPLILAVQMPDGGFGGFDAFEHSIKTINGNELFLPKIPKLTADKYMVKVELTGGAHGYELYHFLITLRPVLDGLWC
jgi:hypothetical protein